MSLKHGQYRSLLMTKEFLYRLLTTDRPKTVKELRQEVRRCLRHYPFLMEDGEPIFSKN